MTQIHARGEVGHYIVVQTRDTIPEFNNLIGLRVANKSFVFFFLK